MQPRTMADMADEFEAAAKVYRAVDHLNEMMKQAGMWKLEVQLIQDTYMIHSCPAAGHTVPYLTAKVMVEI